MYLTDLVCQRRRLRAQTVGRQSASLDSANGEMFISKATCAVQAGRPPEDESSTGYIRYF